MLTRLNNAGRFEPARLFRPERVAVLGGAAAVTVTRTLLAGQFHGAVLPVADAPHVGGVLAYRSIAELPVVPDLAIVCEGADPASVFPALAARGCFAAIVVGPDRRASDGALRKLAEQTGVRSLGPGSFGLAVPAIGLDATLGHRPIRAGRAALVSQSGATCRAVLDWAGPNGVGFSHVVGIGDNDDIGFALVLDWLSRDRGTGAILLDIHHLKDARAFLSAARAAARLRPVVALQSGFRRADPSGAQEVAFRAALARAGVLSVDLLDDLLSAAETLARAKPAQGETVAIVANGHGPADLAADAVLRAGLELAEGSPHCGPTAGLADAARTAGVGFGVGSVLVVHAPEGDHPLAGLVADLATVARDARPPVIVCAMGSDIGAELRHALGPVGLPGFARPEQAVRAIRHLVDDRRNRAAARELPARATLSMSPDRATAIALTGVDGLLAPDAARRVLAAYGIGATALPAGLARIWIGSDPLWGPIIGVGPVWANRWADRVTGLPPLNATLARAMLADLKLARTLAGGARDALADTLARVSALLVDIPRLVAGAFDPGDPADASLDCRATGPAPRLALPPYPSELATTWTDSRGAELTLRPIRPEDADAHGNMFVRLSPEDVRYRFFTSLRELAPEQIARMTDIDYDREIAFVAVRGTDTVGVARLVRDSFSPEAEFAILVQPDAKRAGLARALMERLFDWGRAQGLRAITGQVLAENRPMLAFVRGLGFTTRPLPDEHEVLDVRKEL